MTGHPQSQPSIAEMIAELQTLIVLAKDTRFSAEAIGMRISNTWPEYEKMIAALARIEELKARAEQAEQAVDVLESNAREQAKLLADTGRRVGELEADVRAGLAALPPSSSTGSTDMTLKARNDALHENNVLALRQIEELEAALLAAREYVAGASLAAGTPAYIRCCELLIKIDAALPHVRDPARG